MSHLAGTRKAEAHLVKWEHRGVQYSTLLRYREDADAYVADNEIKNAVIVPLYR